MVVRSDRRRQRAGERRGARAGTVPGGHGRGVADAGPSGEGAQRRAAPRPRRLVSFPGSHVELRPGSLPRGCAPTTSGTPWSPARRSTARDLGRVGFRISSTTRRCCPGAPDRAGRRAVALLVPAERTARGRRLSGRPACRGGHRRQPGARPARPPSPTARRTSPSPTTARADGPAPAAAPLRARPGARPRSRRRARRHAEAVAGAAARAARDPLPAGAAVTDRSQRRPLGAIRGRGASTGARRFASFSPLPRSRPGSASGPRSWPAQRESLRAREIRRPR